MTGDPYRPPDFVKRCRIGDCNGAVKTFWANEVKLGTWCSQCQVMYMDHIGQTVGQN